jgi:hypothetical protein
LEGLPALDVIGQRGAHLGDEPPSILWISPRSTGAARAFPAAESEQFRAAETFNGSGPQGAKSLSPAR